jgi:hypothetical protein
VDAQQLNDTLTSVSYALKEFKSECRPKARPRQLYFVTWANLVNAMTLARNVAQVPADASASNVPEGLDARKWGKLVKALDDAGKLLRDEAKNVPPAKKPPAPLPAPNLSGKNDTLHNRSEWRRKFKKELNAIYGEKEGKLRYGRQENDPKDYGPKLKSRLDLATLEALMPSPASRALSTQRRSAASAIRGITTLQAQPLVPAQGQAQAAVTAPEQGATAGGLLGWLWPTAQPIYKRPGAVIGVAAVVGVVGWMLLSTPKAPEPKAEAK